MPLWLIPITIVYVALAIARFRWALFVLVALLPTYLLRFQIGWLPSTWLEVMIWIVVVVWIVRHSERARRVEESPAGKGRDSILRKILRLRFASLRMTRENWPLTLGIALLLIAATISMFIAPDLRTAAGLWKAYFIEPIALFVVFITTFKKKDIPKIIFALSLTALVTSVLAIYQKFTGAWIPNPYWAAEETRRVTSVWGFPNAIGLFLAPLIPLFITQGWRFYRSASLRSRMTVKKLLITIYYLLITIAALAAIVFAKSTGALVALIAAAILIGIIYKKTRVTTIAVTALAIILIVFLPAAQSIRQELLFQDYSGGLRIDMWGEAVELISDHPILGTGLSSYKSQIHRYRIDKWIEIFQYPHNILLNFWIEIGALGVLAFILIFYWVFKILIPPLTKGGAGRVLNYTLIATFTIILIHGIVDVPYFKNDLAILFWLLITLVILQLNRAKKTDKL